VGIALQLVLVCPELRKRSLALLPELVPDARPTRTQVRTVLLPPVSAADKLKHREESLLGFALRRIGSMTRLGLQIIGAIVMLLVLAQTFAH